MTYFAATALFNGLFALTGGSVIFFQKPRDPKNGTYALFCLSILSFSTFYFVLLAFPFESALFVARAGMMGAIGIPVLHYHHLLLIFKLDTPARRKFLFGAYVVTAFFLLSNLTPLFIARVAPVNVFRAWPEPGVLFYPFVAGFAVMAAMSLSLILEFRKRAPSPILRNELMWIAIGTGIGYAGGATNFFLFFRVPIPPYLNPAMSIFTLIGALLFFRLGLHDFKLFFRDSAVSVLTSILLGGVFSLFILPFQRNFSTVAFVMLFSLASPLVYGRTYAWVNRKINRTKLGRIDRYLATARENLGAIRETTYTYERLASNLVSALLNTFPIDMAAVYMNDLDRDDLYLKAQTGMKNPLASDLLFNRQSLLITKTDPLVESMVLERRIVSREELDYEIRQGKDRQSLLATMDRLEGQIGSPVFVAGRLRGLVVLGEKKGRELFHEADVDSLFSFSRMAEEIMRHVIGMESEINHTALYSHDMNNDTKSLVQTLQFLQSSLADSVDAGTKRQLMQAAQDVATRLNQTFQLNRDRSDLILKSLRGDYVKTDLEVTKLLRESGQKVKFSVEEKRARIETSIPAGPVWIHGNGDDLIRVFDNLLSNAVRYIDKDGRIDLVADVTDNVLRVQVSDDGKGIKKEELEKIWEKGWQAKDARKGASGLGLAIAKQIIQNHGGRIEVKSDGVRGTTFTIHLSVVTSVQGESR